MPPPICSDTASLYVAHHGWLLGWLRCKVHGADHAADLAQDTYLRVLGQRELAALREPRAYLATVARRLLINHAERAALEQAYLDALASLPEARTPPPEQQLLILETLYEIDAMLAGLPPKARAAFLLSQLEGMGYADIGRQLGVTVRTVKRYMACAYTQCMLVMA